MKDEWSSDGGRWSGTENRHQQRFISRHSLRFEIDCPACKYGTLSKKYPVEEDKTFVCIDCGYMVTLE
jgi:transposase-like protein